MRSFVEHEATVKFNFVVPHALKSDAGILASQMVSAMNEACNSLKKFNITTDAPTVTVQRVVEERKA